MTTKTEALAGMEPVQSRKVANNTFEWKDNAGNRHIRLHYTDILTFRPDGSVILNTGGWKTVTTKARMNQFLNVHIHTDRGQWHVTDYARENTVPFVDGMILPSPFRVPPVTAKAKAAEKRDTKLRDAINKFVQQVDKLDAMPVPDNGDCWLCLMFERGFAQGTFSPERGGRISKPGYKTDDVTHLREHIRENYMHGTLIQNAYLWAGYSLFLWNMHRNRWDKYAKDDTKRFLRRYLKRQLGIA